MMMRKPLARCKSMLPTILGLVLGLGFSFLHSSSFVTCGDSVALESTHEGADLRLQPEAVPAFSDDDNDEDFTPKIIKDPNLKPKVDLEANKKKVVRSRYISTELGIRERLVSAVITSEDSVHSMAVSVNKTLSHHLQKLLFFFGSNETPFKGNSQPPGMNIVVHPETEPIKVLYQSLHYMYQRYQDIYDWFFIATDKTYVAGYKINEIINHMSITRKLYMGRTVKIKDDKIEGFYCNIDAGFIISRTLLISVMPDMNKCVTGITNVSPSEWLGKCILTLTKGDVGCVHAEEIQNYLAVNIAKHEDFDPEVEPQKLFEDSVSAFPVTNQQMMFKLHKKFSEVEIDVIYRKIELLQEEIKNISLKTSDGGDGLSWPIGVNPPFQPTTRWDVINWDYFDETHTLTCPGEIPRCELSDMDKKDVDDVIETSMSRLREKYSPKGIQLDLMKLENGYKRFDPQRGMEYLLDLKLKVTVDAQATQISHRIDLLRPLSQVEIIPMPYVTDATKVNIILPVTVAEANALKVFLTNYEKNCLETKENVLLTIIFVYGAVDASKVHQKDDPFSEQKNKLNELEGKYGGREPKAKIIPWMSIKTDVPSQLRIMDVIVRTKKFATDSLFVLSSSHANISGDLLNRCRMNTISGWQAFFPVPFSQYNSNIAPEAKEDIEIKAATGHFDIYSFDEASFYHSDYITARGKFTGGEKNEDVDSIDLYQLFLSSSDLHVFRAVEPTLRRRWTLRKCLNNRGVNFVDRCERSNAEGLGTRTQLAMALFPEEVAKDLKT